MVQLEKKCTLNIMHIDSTEQNEPVPVPGETDGTYLLKDAVADYPAGWDMEHFKALPSYKARGQYAKQRLGKLGIGSARVVFEINDTTVLKLARNHKGLAQNELESDISNFGYDFVAKVFESEKNFLWIESEKARKMKKPEFKRLTGYPFESYTNALVNESLKMRHGRTGMYLPVDAEYADDIYDSELFNEILSFIADYDILPQDFRRLSSWGVVNRDGQDVPVLIDYGISSTIYNDLYVKKKK